MRNVQIEVFPIAHTQVDRAAVQRWLDYLNFSGYEVPSSETITDPALLVAMAAKRCYLAFDVGQNPNLTKVRKDMVDYIDNILASGHGSVLEHATWTFAIEGVSRVFTGEMNRHRAGVAISEGSMRYIRFNDIPYWVPTSIQLTPDEKSAVTACDIYDDMAADEVAQSDIVPPNEHERSVARLARKKMETQEVFADHYATVEKNYAKLQDIWKEELAPSSKFHAKKQITSLIRRIVPMGVATGEVVTLNLRALRHILALRASPAAEEEIALVFSKIGKIMREKEPMIFADFTETPEGYLVPKYHKV